MGYFKEFDKVKKVYNEFQEKKSELNNELDKIKNEKVYPNEDKRKQAQEKVEQQLNEVNKKYNEKIDKAYQKEQEKIKSRVGFGEGSAKNTVAELNSEMLDVYDKTEIQTLADKYQNNNNYFGLKKLKTLRQNGEIPTVDLGNFTSAEKELNELNNYYKGKKRAMSSNDEWLDRMLKLSEKA